MREAVRPGLALRDKSRDFGARGKVARQPQWQALQYD